MRLGRRIVGPAFLALALWVARPEAVAYELRSPADPTLNSAHRDPGTVRAWNPVMAAADQVVNGNWIAQAVDTVTELDHAITIGANGVHLDALSAGVDRLKADPGCARGPAAGVDLEALRLVREIRAHVKSRKLGLSREGRPGGLRGVTPRDRRRSARRAPTGPSGSRP